uniref:glucose-fructose oxidoreductase domain-containing protein 1-like n=1 Tax=Styela clava TaxID=7725 RepID=UPI0019392BDA|nr:glucose-fructose oxidoreductase domain-containing protein 1-like [Styela clava]
MTLPLPGVGVFGTGLSAKAFIIMLRSAGFSIEALWGRTEDEAAELAERMQIPFFTNRIDELLLHQRVDLVCINSPPFLHSQIAVKTLGIGKNVLCERPAGLGYSDTARMINAARYYPSLMSLLGYNLRFLPTFQKMRRLISERFLEDILVFEVRVHCGIIFNENYSWSNDERMGGGMLAAFGSHFLDVLSFVSGQRATKVHGFLTTFQKKNSKINGFREITSDDFCTFQMKMDKNAYCTCVLNNNIPGKFCYEVLAIGTEGRLSAKDGFLYGRKTSDADNKEVLLDEDAIELPSEVDEFLPPEMKDQHPTPLLKGMLKFTEALRDSFCKFEDRRKWDHDILQSASTFEDALYVQTVLDSIRKSSKSCDWEQVPLYDSSNIS